MEFEQFGPYRIEVLIGRGGMGEVYRAFDNDHGRTVALKVLAEHLAADRNYRERFRREAHAAARLSEPHVVPIHRYGEIDGRLFLDMRLVQGRDLGAVLSSEGALSPRRAVSVIGQVAHALDAAHAEGLVHRDVKPSNVLVTGEGDDEFVYLVDFGIARSVDDDGDGPSLTQTGSAVGSFDYMAPERFLERPLDARSDVYSLACVLFECLTGRRPFPGTDLAPLMWAHINTPPPKVSEIRPGLPAALDEVVATGLAKSPEDRWPSTGALAAAARAALSSAGLEPPREAAPPTRVSGWEPAGTSGPHTLGLSAPSDPGPPATGGGPAVADLPALVGRTPTPAQQALASSSGTAPARKSRVPAVLYALAGLLAAALVLVVVLAGTGGRDALAAPPQPKPGAQQDDLLAIIPADFDAGSCRPAPAPDDGAVASIDCGPSASQPGPGTSRFFLYPDGDTADSVFEDDVRTLGLTEFGSGARCPTSQGYGTWSENDSTAGRIACYVDEDNTATLIWTESEDAVEAVARIRNGGTAGLVSLLDWWNDADRSDFGG